MARDRHRIINLDPDTEIPRKGDQLEERINTLAKQVRTIYCVCVRELTGKPNYGDTPLPYWDGTDGDDNKFGSKRQPIWPKIAKEILRQDASPLQYIRAQFRYIQNPTKFPKPNQLYNEAAVARWEDFRDNAGLTLRNEVLSGLNQIKINIVPLVINLKWDATKAVNYVLRDFTNCNASPLIRYCVAVAEQLPIASAYREQALLQYMFQMVDYDALLEHRLPEELRVEARELYRQLAGQ